MKTIICGYRGFNDYDIMKAVIEGSGFDITEVFCGCCRGADQLGDRWAKENNIPIRYFPADWSAYGRPAGPIRNQKMVDEADALIAITHTESRGTMDAINKATHRGLRVFVYNYNLPNIL